MPKVLLVLLLLCMNSFHNGNTGSASYDYFVYALHCCVRWDPVTVYFFIETLTKLYRRFGFSGILRTSSVGFVPGKKFYIVLLCLSCFPVLTLNLYSWFRVNWNIFYFKVLHIHTKGRSFRFNWSWMRFVFLPNKIELIPSIEFHNLTHQKIPVQLCSITELIEQ